MAFSAARREQERSITSFEEARRIVDQNLLDEAGDAMLDFVDESQLVRHRLA